MICQAGRQHGGDTAGVYNRAPQGGVYDHLPAHCKCNRHSSPLRRLRGGDGGCQAKGRSIRAKPKSRLPDSNRKSNCRPQWELLGIWPFLFERRHQQHRSYVGWRGATTAGSFDYSSSLESRGRVNQCGSRRGGYLDFAVANSPKTFDAIASTCCGVIFAKTPPHADEVVL